MRSSKRKPVEEKKKIDKKTLLTRIIAWVLVLMTVVTTLYTAIYFIFLNVNAAGSGDFQVAVGLDYGSSAASALNVGTTNGFIVGSETIEKYDKTFTELWRLDGYKNVVALCDANYKKSGSGKNTVYTISSSPNVGAYRLELADRYQNASSLGSAVDAVNTALEGTDYYAIPTYVSGAFLIRVGSFISESDASAALSEVAAKLPGRSLTVKSPSATGTFAVDRDSAKVLFEYDGAGASFMALDAIDGQDGKAAFLTTTKISGNVYDGAFVFKRADDNKLTLINVVDLETYIAGVIPYEISVSWPVESQKAFAIVARTFAIDQVSKHWKAYGFNICATSNCQVYKGAAYLDNAKVKEAISSTKGKITICNGKLASMYYSSSTGNCTADVSKVWGSKIAWLSGVETPWEDYLNHGKAFWTKEYTPAELCQRLNDKGYTGIKDAVASVSIDETASSISTYVYKVTVTDIHGSSVTITRCDHIRSAFGGNSANFVIGKGSVQYTKYKETIPPSGVARNLSVITKSGTSDLNISHGFSVITGSGTVGGTPGSGLSIITSGGTVTTEGAAVTPAENIYTETATASSPDNFIIVGKGWGHGVGLSQFGMRDLADMGVGYIEMLEAYCPGIKVDDYSKYIG